MIKTDNFTLRSPKLDDCKYFVKWFSDKEIMYFFSAYFWKISNRNLQKYFQDLILGKTEEIFFTIINKQGLPIGGVGADELNNINKSGEFWVLIGDKNYQGKGIGKQATQLFCDYFFYKKKYHRLELEVSYSFNKAIKLYQEVGFKKEGVKRAADFNPVNKKYEDQLLMSILREEWLIKYKN